MPNKNYIRSRNREIMLANKFYKEGWYSIRAAGSKGNADVIAIRPAKCSNPNHFEVKFIQVKVSQKLKNKSIVHKVEEAPFGMINVEYRKYPVKSGAWYKKYGKKSNRNKTKK
ncbi:MAG: hypothetical protein IPM48_14990 [Saprospiraceae bacterium]|nr:hypothetical protein [Saprospiraceae bacterium]